MELILINAIALVFILEGILPFALPKLWREMMTEAIQLDNKQLRIMGFISLVIGVFILLFLAD